ncbi:hypothetical protein CWI37_0006p0010 [Hamiltosporidium tvaerminnensis]|uniref:Uncharacterized protein n=1 Tax=Hamiltosporidium tvaerminnensis TaxID=1176355 RepID=A0A4Q9LF78_9MICR|nr:hypothetical protein CWI37_0006p0010 [Hamiltosporidium tvaerminnensis]
MFVIERLFEYFDDILKLRVDVILKKTQSNEFFNFCKTTNLSKGNSISLDITIYNVYETKNRCAFALS